MLKTENTSLNKKSPWFLNMKYKILSRKFAVNSEISTF